MMALALLPLANWIALPFAHERYWRIATDLMRADGSVVGGLTYHYAEQTPGAIVLSPMMTMPFGALFVDDGDLVRANAAAYGLLAWRAAYLPKIAAIHGLFSTQSAFDHQRGRVGLSKGRVQTLSQRVSS